MATLNLTEREMNAPAGMSTVDGGAMTGYNNIPQPVTQPKLNMGSGGPSSVAPAPTPEPTIGEQLTGIQNEALRIQDILNQRQAEEQALAGQPFQSPTTIATPMTIDEWQPDVDEEQVNRATLKMFQQQIDATNQVYDQLLNQERLQGEGRLGSGRAMAARGGLLGSDFAASQKGKIQDFNTAQERSIQAERTAKIGAILGTARREAAQKIADKRKARQSGYEAYREYLTSGQERLMNNVSSVAQAFIAQGIDPNELDEQELATIASEIGAQPADIITAYQANMAQSTPGGVNEFGFMSTSGGIFRTDPNTGEAVFIPSGGVSSGGSSTTPRQTTPRENEETSAFDLARIIVSDNPTLSDSQLKEQLLENTDLNVTEINTLIENRENRQLPAFNETLTSQIVSKLRDNFTYNDAVDYIENGKITSNGKTYNLTDEQKQALKQALDNERGFLERIIPGGN